ncbi:MAG TPA: hypothetical protein VNL38_00500, partial [Candidatus Nitrosotenuis sp.]|nr:hypothetical protein [Candidatus Nitrosotenuis sp.]
MSRSLKIAVAASLGLLAVAIIYFFVLRGQIERMARPALTEEQARRQVTRPQDSSSQSNRVKAELFWLSEDSPDALAPVEEEL